MKKFKHSNLELEMAKMKTEQELKRRGKIGVNE